MESTDWNQRYIDKSTPWDNGLPSEDLVQFRQSGKIKPCRVLEFGCGTGTNAIYLAQQGFEVTAADLSPSAIEQAKAKAEEARVSVRFIQADLTSPPDLGGAYPFVFDRGVYHVIRTVNIAAFQKTLAASVAPGGFYLALAGNANTTAPEDKGPPVVRAQDLCAELESQSFDLVELRESRFDVVKFGGIDFAPLSWFALFKKRNSER